MKKLFATSAIGAVMIASASNAQMLLDKEEILSSDETATVILMDKFAPVANEFNILCPSKDGMYGLYPNDGGAVILLSHLDRESIHTYAGQFVQNPDLYENDTYTASRNYGFITPDGRLQPTYTNRETANKYFEWQYNAAKAAGHDPHNPDLIKAARKHAENFCFSSF